ncbi:probable G-protein coupled receptor 139 [Chiloscyllium punctatum]|uniref:probable G-protein coupled receptor 139 n=1 Tax=Chiloscyllium punctatum TaxID=137246 RepID=UPI003B636C31
MEPATIVQVERIYMPILAAVGVPVNLVAIVILSRRMCSLSKCIIRYLFGMAVADLLVVVMEVILRWMAAMYFRDSFLLITPVCCLTTTLSFAATVVSIWLTVAFTFDRFVAICCEKLKIKYCTEKTATVVITTVSTLSCLETLPWYFTQEARFMIGSVPWECRLKLSVVFSTSWTAFMMFHFVLTPILPFFLVFLLNILTVRRIVVTSRVRHGFQGCSIGENHKDREMEKRRRSIVLLFSISGTFIILLVARLVYNIYLRIANIAFYTSRSDPRYITERATVMLQLLSTCTNTFIYTVTQQEFRNELKNGIKYPFNHIVKLIKL